MKYPKEYLEAIKSRLKVSTVVSRSVNLKKRGKEFIGLSPFTNEKTPSFTVNDQKGFYHCFSSNEHGNIFDFLMKTANMKFGEVVRTLASEAGLPIYKFTKLDEEKEKKWQLYSKILEQYKSYYHNALKNKKSKELESYLYKRGLTDKEINYFKIGFVPKEAIFFDKLKDNFSESDILNSGLFYFDEKNKKYVERFRDRLIFPINGLTGSTIAFGGRIISNQKLAKYINSPETLFFKKGNSLFHLDKLRHSPANHDEVFLVEGYMDVVTLTKYGILNVVANLGTALTERQVETVWRFFNHIIICFDGDQGGVNAAVRAADRLLSVIRPDFKISFLFLPKNKDPDNFIAENGKDYFFLSNEDFIIKINDGKFLEYEEVYDGTFYGTLKDEVEKNWQNGKHVIFDIDVVGGINIKKLFPERTLAIFVKPPSIKVLEERLTNRGGNSQEDIKKRVQKAIKEMEYSSDFDKIILNDELEESKRIAFDYVNNFLNQ